MTDEYGEIMTKKEASQFLRVNPRTLDRWIKKGMISSRLIGSTVRVLKSEIMESLMERKLPRKE